MTGINLLIYKLTTIINLALSCSGKSQGKSRNFMLPGKWQPCNWGFKECDDDISFMRLGKLFYKVVPWKEIT